MQRRLYAEMGRETRDAGEMTSMELVHAENRIEAENAPGHWPWAAIKRCEGWTLRGLEELADDEAKAIRRFHRHIARVAEHERRRGRQCSCNPGGVWTFFTNYDGADEDHVWTLRILRGARRAAARTLDQQ